MHKLSGETMGTTWSVSLAAAHPDLRAARATVEAELDLVVNQMSLWEPDSDICRFNALPAGEAMPAPAALMEVLRCALGVARRTGGAFDPALASAAEAWGFGPSGTVTGHAPLPSQAGWRDLVLDGDRLVQPGGIGLDLGGIAKGYAVDRVAAALDGMGFRSHLVEVGGELRGAGTKPDGQPWWVEVEPVPGMSADTRTLVALHGLSIAGSGDYRRYFERDGVRHSHSLDPRTGAPARTDLRAVSVLHVSCMKADALATAMMVMGCSAAMKLATDEGVAALFTTADGRSLASSRAEAMSLD